MLPEVHNSSEVIGRTSPMSFFGGQVPIASVIGDRKCFDGRSTGT